MKIAKEAIPLVAISFAGFLISIYCVRFSKFIYIISFLLFFIFLFSVYFFRDPERNYVFKENEFPSPADGRIFLIDRKSIPGTVIIRIFMSVTNVHVQRSPLNGVVKKIQFIPGTFHVAYEPMANDNQRNLMEFTDTYGNTVKIEQITGALARRIACYVKEGDSVKKGDKIGMIYLGSQVAVYLPENNFEITVKEGDKVFAHKTVIALWKKN